MSSRILAVLNSHIPHGGFGRRLTSTEAANLRRHGYVIPRRSIVVQRNGYEFDGWVYAPSPGVNQGFDSLDIRVTIRPTVPLPR